MTIKSRNNPQTRRLAKYLYDKFSVQNERHFDNWHRDQNYWYDDAVELQYKLVNNEFTEPDNHDD